MFKELFAKLNIINMKLHNNEPLSYKQQMLVKLVVDASNNLVKDPDGDSDVSEFAERSLSVLGDIKSTKWIVTESYSDSDDVEDTDTLP